MENKKMKIVAKIFLIIFLLALILGFVAFYIYVWITYGNASIEEIPAWAIWIMFGGNKNG